MNNSRGTHGKAEQEEALQRENMMKNLFIIQQ